ncbi:MAG: transposase [Anaeromicrobium sp.]|jgi:putative transposase|uniref:transposase n=1 Tax=Anaeromicrobium sp. TaxID=1929132 RepID=UPI0025CFED03|nr:transposase [Anaeromicrobium sp.]MCT4596134.1 transposase [Anaeromicrobium sp.]
MYAQGIFLKFIKKVMTVHPTGKILMILVHQVKMIETFLLKYTNRLEFSFLVPYRPKFNLVEGLWGWLKAEITNNVFYTDACKIKLKVRKFIRSINLVPEQVISRSCLQK